MKLIVPGKSLIALALVPGLLPLAAKDPGLLLTLSASQHTIRVGEHPVFTITISNRGPQTVTLVQPGDGSDCRMRTPLVGWSILSADAPEQKHPKSVPPFQGVRTCGRINPIKHGEVFSLASGAGMRLVNWTADPKFEKPGRFRLVFYYENIPNQKITGYPLGPHDDGVLDRIKKSTRCRLVSQEIAMEVLSAEDTKKLP